MQSTPVKMKEALELRQEPHIKKYENIRDTSIILENAKMIKALNGFNWIIDEEKYYSRGGIKI